MSEQIYEFDQIVRDRLSDQTTPPPPAVWENIQSSRSFGHVVANKISTNWGMFGTLLMLLFAGGSAVYLFGEEEKSNPIVQASTIEILEQWNSNEIIHEVESLTQYNAKGNRAVIKESNEQNNRIDIYSQEVQQEANMELNRLPDVELMASLNQAAFVKPVLHDERLSAYIEELKGWEDAKPKSFVRYYQMHEIPNQGVNKADIEQFPIDIELEEYDYAMPRVERKTFKDRSSILLTVTPQIVSKIMTAEYNLSSSYLDLRDKTEKTRFAYTFGALLHYEIKNHKFIETGINFSQIYEEMRYEGEKRFSNQYNFVEIPILIGYGDRNAKWGWEFKAGLGLQVHNSYKGYILKRIDEFGSEPEPADESLYRRGNPKSSSISAISNSHSLSQKQARNEVVDLEDEEANPFKSRGVVNVHFATGLVYYHSINTAFVITPSYKRSINSITKEEALFNERIQCVGVSFGARMKF